MRWQDWVLTGGSITFSAALLPSLFGAQKPALGTSLTTGLVLVVFACTYASLSLWFSATATSVNALLWLTLAVQHLARRRQAA